jgi:3-oxoacyl-(acyl-carrier-protein) synthase
MIVDAIPAYIALKYGFRGETFYAVAACASSAKTIGAALLAIERGDLDVIIAGGAEAPFTGTAVAAFSSCVLYQKETMIQSMHLDLLIKSVMVLLWEKVLAFLFLNLYRMQKNVVQKFMQNLQDTEQHAMRTM